MSVYLNLVQSVEKESQEVTGIAQNANFAYASRVELSFRKRIIQLNVPSVEENFNRNDT
jgi:hypothetical protein